MTREAFHTFILLIVTLLVSSACSYRIESNLLEFDRVANVQINRSFDHLPNGSYLYFQNGVKVTSRQLDKWSGYCSLYIYDDNHGADYINAIRPGRFRITGISNGRQVVENTFPFENIEYLVASLFWEHDHIPSYIDYRLKIDLYAAEQRAVRALICNQRAASYGDYYPTLGQIRHILGDIIQIGDRAL